MRANFGRRTQQELVATFPELFTRRHAKGKAGNHEATNKPLAEFVREFVLRYLSVERSKLSVERSTAPGSPFRQKKPLTNADEY
jgi:hypothetical protein